MPFSYEGKSELTTSDGVEVFTNAGSNPKKRLLLQTYYTTDAFFKLAKSVGFRVKEHIPVKDLDSAAPKDSSDPFSDREVVLLYPK